MKRVAITGARGFVGSAIGAWCRREGFEVRAVDRPSCDVTSAETLRSAFEGVDYVIHCAGLAHIFDGPPDAEAFRAVNAVGSENVVRAAARSGVEQIVAISSVSVYGNGNGCSEEHRCDPVTPYARSKLEGERLAIRAARETGVNLTILRLATVYGPGDPGNVGRLAKALEQRRFIWIGDGINRKSLIHRDDVAAACVGVLRRRPVGIECFNLSAEPVTMAEVVEGLSAALGRSAPSLRVPVPAAYVVASAANLVLAAVGRPTDLRTTVRKWVAEDVYPADKFRAAFAWEPQVPLRRGLGEVAKFLRACPPRIR